MNKKRALITLSGVLALAAGMCACSNIPREENVRIVPHRAPGGAAMPMMSYTAAPVIGIDYTEVHDEWSDPELMKQARGDNSSIVIHRGSQRGQFLVNGKTAMDFPVCLGRQGHKTPLGTFHISQKDIDHVSNLYDAQMPYFMRLTDSGVGLHVGPVFRTPQSHGCIRMTRTSCVPIYKAVKIGTPVRIVE